MAALKKNWTQEDKYWAIGGAAVAVGGGLYWYIQSQKDKQDEAAATKDGTYLDTETQTQPTLQTGTKPKPKPVKTPRQPDAVKYKVGQEVMAIGFSGTKGYQTRKMANGNYTTDTPAVVKATFRKGDKIGRIIWVGGLPDGTFRYVIQRDGKVLNQIYWIADYRLIKPINLKATPRPQTGAAPKSVLNVNLVLKKGSKGAEVKELQKILGIKSTIAGFGTFGTQTENLLIARKGVKQITLSKYGIK